MDRSTAQRDARRAETVLEVCPTRAAPTAAPLASSALNVWSLVSTRSSNITAGIASASGVGRGRSNVAPAQLSAADSLDRTAEPGNRNRTSTYPCVQRRGVWERVIAEAAAAMVYLRSLSAGVANRRRAH